MPLTTYIPCLRLIVAIVIPASYIASFANSQWVKTGNIEWGLWQWCFRNISDVEAESLGITRCRTIAPGDSPAYYEAVRTIATFTLVAHLPYFSTCDTKKGLGVNWKPIIVASAALSGSVITLGVLGGHYKDDSRWKNDHPSLGWCFWVVTASAILGFVMIGVFYKFREMTPTAAVANHPPVTVPQRRSSAASSLDIDDRRKITIFQSYESGSPVTPQQSSAGESGNAEGSTYVGRSSGFRRVPSNGDTELPVLDLPVYDLAPEPEGRVPSVAPPGYEEVAMGGSVSPPPPYTVTAFGAEKKG